MKLRYGLQVQFLSLLVLALVAALVLFGLLFARQEHMQRQVVDISSRAVEQAFVAAQQRRGEKALSRLAESLVIPMSDVDLDAIGGHARALLREPGMRYVIVYDASGIVLHDGSDDVPGAGRPMSDALASGVRAAQAPLTQYNASTMDVSAPVALGKRVLGGVRIGYDLDVARGLQASAVDDLRARLSAVGDRGMWWLGMLGLAVLVLGGGVLWLMQRAWVAPIRLLADSARAREAGQATIAPPATGRDDEVGDLMRAFGRMSDSAGRHDRDLRRIAYTDALTGLANRLAFREALELRLLQLHGAGRQLALLFADVDDFKRVNDTLGHDAGDEMLLEFASRIKRVIERSESSEDALLARFGGDEFVILVEPGPGQVFDVRGIASRLAEALIAELARPVEVHGQQVFLGTSIGITLFPEDASGVTTLLKNGDIAMYQAKVAGKNCHRFYSRTMDQAAERRVVLEQELRGAWDRGELSLAYQPVYRMADGAVVGAEALLRWNHPTKGAIAPTVFIDVAEQSGLIETIGPQVLRAACEDAAAWQALRNQVEPVFVAVNVSPRQLRSGDLPRIVADCLRDTGLSPALLHVELTETAVIGDEAHASNLLSQLRATGVKVWLDDFGTGFSGLSHLRRVPVDGVKIDRSFVADILRDPDDLALTTAIIAMGHSLGITVVAEGVEKEGQYMLLRERGCDFAQGYWLGHPLPVDQFIAQLRKRGIAPRPALC